MSQTGQIDIMNDWQTPVALLVVLGAAVYLGRLFWKSRRAPGSGCSAGCCPPKPGAKPRK